jgi:quercetin dioxygenase-like cupin family protein
MVLKSHLADDEPPTRAAEGAETMGTAASSTSAGQDAFWWQGSLMRIKARAEDTGGALALIDATFPGGFGPPLHVHRHEDEAFYILEGRIRFRRGDDELVAGPGAWVWGPRGVPHTFKVESESARALVLITPGGLERMFEEGGVPAGESDGPPVQVHEHQAAAIAMAARFGFEVIGPPLA